MFRNGLAATGLLAILISGALASAPAFAKKPPEAGGGKGPEHAQKQSKGKSKKGFDENDHVIVREYFAQEFRGGHCPPGLAKKRNGCLPPGQAKKWRVGQPLPRDVVIYDLPSKLVVKIGLPPSGHKYVRVAADGCRARIAVPAPLAVTASLCREALFFVGVLRFLGGKAFRQSSPIASQTLVTRFKAVSRQSSPRQRTQGFSALNRNGRLTSMR
jgi:hypothetical protein